MSDNTKLAQQISELADRAMARVARGSEIPPRLLDIDDAGRYLGMSDKGVRELIINGELPYIQKIPARSPYLIDIEDLNFWITRNKVRAGR